MKCAVVALSSASAARSSTSLGVSSRGAGVHALSRTSASNRALTRMSAAYRHTLWAAMAQLRAIVQDSDMNLFVEVPEPLVESFGKGKRPPILVMVNGVEYRTRLMVY